MAKVDALTLNQRFDQMIGGMITNFVGNFNPAIKRSGEYLCNKNLPNAVPSIEDLLLMNYRGFLSESDLQKFFEYYGYDKLWLTGFDKINRQYLSPHEYVQLYQREKISKGFLDKMMKEIKCNDQLSQYQSIMEYFPTVPDLVRFAVREAYTPEVIQKFGNLEELPQKFLVESKKAGLPEEQAKNYWASHWELPSMQMGFEMLHRTSDMKLDNDADSITCPSGKVVYNVIGTKTMDTLIKTLDITPYWRNKLKAISYNPLTRVDVRRMYSMSVIDEDKVFTSYLDEGYNSENALLLTNFVVKEYSQEMNGITRATLERAFKDDLLTTEEFKEQLVKLRMTEDTAEFYVSIAEYDKHMTGLKSLIDMLSIQFSEGILTLDEVRAKITLENVPTSFVESAIVKIQKQRITTRKLPSLADCQRWLKANLIDIENFKTRLHTLGYSRDDTDIYAKEITGV
jgi:hypothetical protein